MGNCCEPAALGYEALSLKPTTVGLKDREMGKKLLLAIRSLEKKLGRPAYFVEIQKEVLDLNKNRG